MQRKDFSWGLWSFLLLTVLILLGLYSLPSELLGVKLKRVDLLSALRREESTDLQIQTAEEIFAKDKNETPSIATDSIPLLEQEEVARRQALTEEYTIANAQQDTLSAGSKVLIQDYSEHRNALHHAVDALDQKKRLRIAVLGDSFIEGDIFTYDLRRLLQKQFGGYGVGWMPITSKVANFRKGIQHSFDGWKTLSVISHNKGKYFFGETYFIPTAEKAIVKYQWTEGLGKVSSAEIFYSSSEPLLLTTGGSEEAIDSIYLSPSSTITAHRVALSRDKVSFTFHQAKGATLYGIALENNPSGGGVTVDNFSLRGSSGISLANIDPSTALSMDKLRHYQLIILQYGLNVIEKERLNYTAYAKRMVHVISTLKRLFPTSDILVMGVSDRAGNLGNGEKGTMKAVLALREAMRGVAMQCKVAYWDTYEAMQTGGGMVQFVAEGKAAKDYTHLSFSGGRYLASKFVESFLIEKDIYQQSKR